MRRRFVNFLSGIVLLCGVLVLGYPVIQKQVSEKKARHQISIFQEWSRQKFSEEERKPDVSAREEEIFVRLREDVRAYNEKIFNGYSGISDPFSFETAAFDLQAYGMEDNIFGYIEIPGIQIELPLYLGASEVNLSRGTAALGGTSIPVGGMHTNTVVAAHRGYSGQPMFRDIEELQKGDRIYITNVWETLCYEVTETKVIDPTDVSEIRIQENKDMVTLLTCHPYTRNIQRYLVYCERVTEGVGAADEREIRVSPLDKLMALGQLSSSQRRIFLEQWAPAGVYAFLILVFAGRIVFLIVENKRKKEDHEHS